VFELHGQPFTLLTGEPGSGALGDELKKRLELSENWAQLLSGGEQQRLAFARALLYRPDWLFLDEATAALPDADQDRLYRLLKERLPDTTLVSIGHREALAAHHDQRLVFGSGQLRQQPG